eukprot:3734394-Rhodomonas_salina.3
MPAASTVTCELHAGRQQIERAVACTALATRDQQVLDVRGVVPNLGEAMHVLRRVLDHAVALLAGDDGLEREQRH